MKKITVFAAIAFVSVASNATEIIRGQLGGRDNSGKEFRIIAKKPEHYNRKPLEPAIVSVRNDKDNLYLSLSMKDNDTLSEAKKDQDTLRNQGDALQIFLKSEKETYLWEFQVNPFGRKSCFFHPGAGRMFYPEPGSRFPDFTVENQLGNGKWDVYIAIPAAIFREKGFKFTNDEKWTIMVVRHNFSRFHNEREISSYPQALANVAYPEYFAELILK